MRSRALAGGVVASAAVLTLGWQIGAAQVAASSATASASSSEGSGSTSSGTATTAPPPSDSSSSSGSSSSGSSSDSSSAGSSSSGSSSSSSSSGSSSSGSVSRTFDGTTAQTRFGPVQVEIVVSAGKITDVKALQLTNDGGRSVEISNQAAPILRSEALSAQSASIQSVSGATYTSEGYTTSLQSAIDQAGL